MVGFSQDTEWDMEAFMEGILIIILGMEAILSSTTTLDMEDFLIITIMVFIIIEKKSEFVSIGTEFKSLEISHQGFKLSKILHNSKI